MLINNIMEKDKIISKNEINLDNIINLVEIDSYTDFIIFKSIYNIFELIYISNEVKNNNIFNQNSIICFDLANFQRINEIKNQNASGLKHILDSYNKKDLLLTYSNDYVKIWDINTIEVLFKINKYFEIVCFIKEKEQILFMGKLLGRNKEISNLEIYSCTEGLKKNIKGLKFQTVYIEAIYKDISIYILLIQDEFKKNSNLKYSHLISYDYYNDRVYKKYLTSEKKWYYDGYNLNIYQKNSSTELIVNFLNSKIVILDFDSGDIIQEIKLDKPYEVCVWNNKYLIGYFVLYERNFKTILKFIDLEKGLVVKDIKTFEENGINCFHFKKIIHPFYGECLIGFDYKEILLLTNIK